METTSKGIIKNGLGKIKFDWLKLIFIQPKKTFQKILASESAVWLTPLLMLSIFAVIMALVASPIKRDAIINSSSIPQDFEYYSVEQQSQYLANQTSKSSALFTFFLPVLGSLANLWLWWFLLSSILHLGNSIAGSSTEKRGYYNLVAWAMSPILLRQLIQIIYMLASRQVIAQTGLAGFVTGTSGAAAFLAGILAQVDIWFIWEIVMILIGIEFLSGLRRSKCWVVVGIAFLIMLFLFAFPHVISSMISRISSGGI